MCPWLKLSVTSKDSFFSVLFCFFFFSFLFLLAREISTTREGVSRYRRSKIRNVDNRDRRLCTSCVRYEISKADDTCLNIENKKCSQLFRIQFTEWDWTVSVIVVRGCFWTKMSRGVSIHFWALFSKGDFSKVFFILCKNSTFKRYFNFNCPVRVPVVYYKYEKEIKKESTIRRRHSIKDTSSKLKILVIDDRQRSCIDRSSSKFPVRKFWIVIALLRNTSSIENNDYLAPRAKFASNEKLRTDNISSRFELLFCIKFVQTYRKYHSLPR